MARSLVTMHDIVRWLILASALVALAVMFRARERGGWTHGAHFWSQSYAWLLGLQSVFGVSVWLLQTRWEGGNAFLSWIHPAAMLLAVGLAHGGLAHAYRTKDPPRTNRLATAAILGSLAVLVLAIPWLAH